MYQDINNIKIQILKVLNPNTINIDGISFFNVKIIKVLIDDKDLRDYGEVFKDMLIYPTELINSTKKSGKYLIITCGCGIADDGGWEGVNVTISKDTVNWKFIVEDYQYSFTFIKEQYLNEINNMLTALTNEDIDIILEPKNVIFPEDW